MTTHLFGPGRVRVGYENMPWSVWVLGMDELHDRPTLDECLALAAEMNAAFAGLRTAPVSEFDPVCYAVVVHHGYAWSTSSIVSACGNADCAPCKAKENTE